MSNVLLLLLHNPVNADPIAVADFHFTPTPAEQARQGPDE